MKTHLFIFSQYLLPQHLLSRLIGKLAASKIGFIKKPFIHWFAKKYQVDMSIAQQESLDAYPSFNAFFTRTLKPDARPIDASSDGIACPADGVISQLGPIEEGRIFQAKNRYYSLEELLGGQAHVPNGYHNGQFATIYLSPKDYHRVHMPASGTLTKMLYIPGDLFSVNTATADNVPKLFARNERAVCFFEQGEDSFIVVLVGAMIVAGIETVWAGQVAPEPRTCKVYDYKYPQKIDLAKGQEMGLFKLGSTAIVLFPKTLKQAIWEEELKAGSAVSMGKKMGVWA